MIWTSQEKSFPYHGALSVRIEIDMIDPFFPRQRHIWRLANGEIETER